MNFEDFRKDIESKLSLISEFELVDFHFVPYSFVSGILVYRIKGRNYKFIFDGRDNVLTWLMSEPHIKYSKAKFKELNGLQIENRELEDGIKI